MDYQAHYDRLMARAKLRKLDCYTERHHILPRCMGGDDKNGNLVELTPEEHYVAHQLLVKLNPGKSSLVYATWMMSFQRDGSRAGNKRFGWIRREYAIAVSKRFKGKKHTEEQIAKNSDAHKGIVLSAATRKKMSDTRKGYMPTAAAVEKTAAFNRGKKLSDEHCAKLKASHKGMTGKTRTETHNANWAASRMGHIVSGETRAKISNAKKGTPWSASRRAAQENRSAT